MLYNVKYLWKFILHKGAAFKRTFKIYFSNSIHISEIIGTESNRLNSKSLDFTSSSKYERRVHGSETSNQSMYNW